jgi:hypothetical protein
MWRVARRIASPTLVITGRQDRLVDVRVAPAVAKMIEDSRLLVLDQVGHVAQMERPDIVARSVIAMLNEVALERAIDAETIPATVGDDDGEPPAAPVTDALATT